MNTHRIGCSTQCWVRRRVLGEAEGVIRMQEVTSLRCGLLLLILIGTGAGVTGCGTRPAGSETAEDIGMVAQVLSDALDAAGDVAPDDWGVYNKKVDGQWLSGYCLCDGTRLTEPVFVEINRFNGGRAAVKFQDEWLILSADGTFRPVETSLSMINTFSDGYATVVEAVEDPRIERTGFGYINAEGVVVHVPDLEYAKPFSSGVAVIQEAQSGPQYLVNDDFEVITTYPEIETFKFGRGAARMDDGRWILIGTNGERILDGDFELPPIPLRDHVVLAHSDGTFTLLDHQGNALVERLTSITNFVDGYAFGEHDDGWKLYNTNGEIVAEDIDESALFEGVYSSRRSYHDVSWIGVEGEDGCLCATWATVATWPYLNRMISELQSTAGESMNAPTTSEGLSETEARRLE